MTAQTIHIIDTRKRAAVRPVRQAPGLLRIDGEIVSTADAARRFGIAPNELRRIVRRLGLNTSEGIRQWVAKK